MMYSRKILLLVFFIFSENIHSSITDYVYPFNSKPSFSNYGGIGLIQMPNARFLEEGSIGISWSDVDPYQRGSIIAYPFEWLEASYQYTDINNALYSDVAAFSGDQTYKDKGFDVKLLLLRERRYTPAVAVGLRDFAGTGIFSSEYIVASKKIKNIDLSGGMGFGTLSSNNFNNPFASIDNSFNERTTVGDTLGGEANFGSYFSGKAGIFAGAEIVIPNSKGLRVKVEYDSTDYSIEGFPDGRESFSFAFAPVKQSESRINYGLVYPLSQYIQLKLNYIKGNTINFGFSISANLGKKNSIVKKYDPYIAIENSDSLRKENALKYISIYRSVLRSMRDQELYLQHADIQDATLHTIYTQSKFQSQVRATGRAMRVMNEVSPDYIKEFKVSNINAESGMHSVTIDRETFQNYADENLYKLIAREAKIEKFNYKKEDFAFNPRPLLPKTYWDITPDLRSQIGGPDGFYFGNFRIAFNAETLFARNISFTNKLSVGIYDTFDGLKLKSDSILPHVRTDNILYLKQSREFALERSQFNFFYNLKPQVFSKFSFGYLEEMFGGLGGEVLFRSFEHNYGIGAEIWRVKQRDYNQRFGFQKYQTTTGFINFYYEEPRSNILFTLKGGRYLAEDSGITIDLSRRFKSGLSMGIFASKTDISKFEFGEGSFDKGFYFNIPVEAFLTNYSQTLSGFGLRPIMRDGAAILFHSHHLWGITDQASKNSISRDWDDFYE
ncbi:YjbH domain-containing protein [Gammaproteobacteria bacterium]|nr:YjbH domain-containing protein [Gammaproteobacteria bacterium]